MQSYFPINPQQKTIASISTQMNKLPPTPSTPQKWSQHLLVATNHKV